MYSTLAALAGLFVDKMHKERSEDSEFRARGLPPTLRYGGQVRLRWWACPCFNSRCSRRPLCEYNAQSAQRV